MDVKMNNDTIDVLLNFIRNQEGWDLRELTNELISRTGLAEIKIREDKKINVDLDECSIIWGGDLKDADILCGADDLVNDYTRLLLNGICNMLESFKDQECFLYKEGK